MIDPLHCLELNVAKTAFKYSFLDKMDDSIREKVTAYMAEIGCYLDLRAKGQRNPEQKWMTGATVDDYVLGKQRDLKSKQVTRSRGEYAGYVRSCVCAACCCCRRACASRSSASAHCACEQTSPAGTNRWLQCGHRT